MAIVSFIVHLRSSMLYRRNHTRLHFNWIVRQSQGFPRLGSHQNQNKQNSIHWQRLATHPPPRAGWKEKLHPMCKDPWKQLDTSSRVAVLTISLKSKPILPALNLFAQRTGWKRNDASPGSRASTNSYRVGTDAMRWGRSGLFTLIEWLFRVPDDFPPAPVRGFVNMLSVKFCSRCLGPAGLSVVSSMINGNYGQVRYRVSCCVMKQKYR